MHDLLKPHGVLMLATAVMLLEPGAWCHFGTCCTSFCWINSGTHRRSAFFPHGNDQLEYVRNGTRLAALTSAMCQLCYCRGVVFSLENPVNSCLMLDSSMQMLLSWMAKRAEEGCDNARVLQHSVSLGSWGAESRKPVWIYCNHDLSAALECHGSPERHEPRRGPSLPVTYTCLGYDL